MTELKQCPFCGSEAKMESMGRGPYQTRVGCSECSCTLGYHVSKKRAIEAWNTRAERTCHPVPKYNDESPWPVMVCSECGRSLHYDATKDGIEYSPYCVCGAKVVE